MTIEVKITHVYAGSEKAILVKMMRGHAEINRQVINPGCEGAALVYEGQAVSIEEIEMEKAVEVPEVEVPPEDPVYEIPADAVPQEGEPVEAPLATFAPDKPATKKASAK